MGSYHPRFARVRSCMQWCCNSICAPSPPCVVRRATPRSLHVCVYVCVCVCDCVSVCIYMYIHVYCMYTYMYIYTYIYIYTYVYLHTNTRMITECLARRSRGLMHEFFLSTKLQHTATYCNILQHTATHCNTLHHIDCGADARTFPLF